MKHIQKFESFGINESLENEYYYEVPNNGFHDY
jgi:hypothetical protein